jgi:molecular chaperone GrpE (heat shock protein)
MRDQMAPKLSKLPFLLSDGLMLGLAFLIYAQSKPPMSPWEIFACTLCVAVGTGCCVLPYVLEYRVLTKLILADHLVDAASEIPKLEQLAGQISGATGLWQTVQESADKTASTAKEISERMAAEAKDFKQFLQHSNEGEKSTLRLEVEKLRRAESDWLQVLVRLLDHIYALHQAALRSRQPSLIDQLGQFQNACRDAARRVGLTPFVAAPEELFDKQRHQLADVDSKPETDAKVDVTIASGYTFQGKLLRPALVRLRNGHGSTPANPDPAAASHKSEQNQLPLDPVKPA